MAEETKPIHNSLVNKPPKIIILAGPNGAGKTTFAREFLLGEAACPAFLNADLIAAGLSPFQPERAAIKAARLLLQSMEDLTARREAFALETTLSGVGYSRHIRAWQAAGYRVVLVFLSLASSDVAVKRVAERVRQGGHDIPVHVIRRRFEAGKCLFETVYKPLVDHWVLYDNGGNEPVLLDWRGKFVTPPACAREPEPPYDAGRGVPIPPEVEESFAALRRAAARARKVALQTGTDLIVHRDGQTVRVNPANGESRDWQGKTPLERD